MSAHQVAIVGCGFVADYYLATLRQHPALKVIGIHDRQAERANALSRAYGVPVIESLQAVLGHVGVGLLLNLTNPREHHAISKAALLAGKHVYSEKPLAMEMTQARELVELAAARGLHIASAPCTVLSRR